MFYILMGMLCVCFGLTILRQKKYQDQPKMQRILSYITYILLAIVILITIFG